MSFEKFLDTISSFVPGFGLKGKEEFIKRLDPDKIYLENVRSLLGVSTQSAFDYCEAAVRQGAFRRGVEAVLPDGSVAASADDESHLPQSVHWWKEKDGDFEDLEIPTATLAKVAYYRLNA